MRGWPAQAWLKAGLGAALALNLVLAALLLAPALGLWPAEPPPPRPDLAGFQARLAEALPAAERQPFLRILEAARPEALAALDRHRALRERTETLLGQEPFDPTALRAALQEARQQWQQFSITLEDSLIDAVTTLSPEGRHRLAEAMRQRRADRGGRAP
ncbi:periplasmic heavy metal sensor [Pseudoroseomonas cervicalis]|uniref:periplasmic heavy metal sensor n=1 Tax=Teichococcus cervicalis TaxID=204525 RepID=UPI0022F1CF84|nr:periplasmic heavy metal sensor [Pseudoroseomonas cervicalis]WBV44396.1 periplasmic heavy metal sensor [Pseudoroseomonas cervicalis]